MDKIDSLTIFVVLAVMLVFTGILFGPSLFSQYQNWKIRRGIKR